MPLDILSSEESVRIWINDVTLREWDQAPLTSFNSDEKKIIALMLKELGVDNIEAWFASSRADFDNIKWVFEVMDAEGPIIATLWRANQQDTQASIDVVKWHRNARIHIFLATSDEHIRAKFARRALTLEEQRVWLLDQIINEVWRAKSYKDSQNPDLEIEFSPEDATWNARYLQNDWKKYFDLTSSQFDFLVQACETAIKSWATIINTPDTLWNLLPHQTEQFFKELSNRLSHLREIGYQFELSAHIHNDLDMATANAISAIRWWATQIEVTLLGIWERAWNTPLHTLIWNISDRGHDIMDEGRQVVLSETLKTQLVWPTSEFVRRILNLNKSLQEPFIWVLSDVDWSGVHNAAQSVYGGTKDKRKYWWLDMEEFFSPRWGSNQIISLLTKYWIQESRDSQLISAVTEKACKKSEQVKALYWRNIYSLYQRELWLLSVPEIVIDWTSISINFTYKWNRYTISGEWDWENWYIDGLISWVNKFIWADTVNVKSIQIINKPSLREAYERYLEDVWNVYWEISQDTRTRIENIVSQNESSSEKSRQIWVSHVKLSIWDTEVCSVSGWYDISNATAQAILEWVLPEILRKIENKN